MAADRSQLPNHRPSMFTRVLWPSMALDVNAGPCFGNPYCSSNPQPTWEADLTNRLLSKNAIAVSIRIVKGGSLLHGTAI